MSDTSRGCLLPLILLCGLWCGLTLTVLGGLETWLVRELSLSHGAAGLAQSVFFVGSLLGSVLSGWLLQVSPTRLFGAVSLLVLMAGNLLCGIPSFLTLVMGRLLAGLGVSGTVVFVSALLVIRFQKRQAALLNVLHGTIAAGAVASMIGARVLASAGGSWTAPLWCLAAAGLPPVLLLGLGKIPTVRDASRPMRLQVVTAMIRRPQVVVTFLLMVGYMIAEQGVTTYFAAYLEQQRGLAASSSATLSALFWMGLGAGRLLFSLVPRRFGERGQIRLLMPLGLGLLLTSMLVTAQGGILACMFASGMLLGPVIPLAFSHATRLVQHKGGMLGASNAVAGLGGALGPLVIGLAADSMSLRSGLIAGLLLSAVCLLPFALGGPVNNHTKERQWPR